MLSPLSQSSSSSSDEELDELIYETVPHIARHSAHLLQSHITTSGIECHKRNMGDIARRDRERAIGHNRLWNDYFAENRTYNERQFRRRFRMRRQLFLRIVEAMQNERYFQQKPDAVGRLGLSGLQKCTAAIRMLSYGIPADAVDEYVRIGESTARECLLKFTKGIIQIFGDQYLRRPTSADLSRLLHIGTQRGFPGMIGSIDCMHWEWKNCPAAWRGQFQGRSGKATLVLEAVASQDLWIWHAFFGIPGSSNDLNVLYRSPVFDDILNGRAPQITYVVNGHQYDMGYYLTDGIYPPWATFIQSINLPQTNKEKLFAQVQEAARKDVERAFGVLQSRFAVIRRPSLAWNQQVLGNIMKACIIMHNMIVEDERDTYEHYTDPSDFIQEDGSSSSRRAEFDEPFEFSAERIVDINTYLTNRGRVRDRNTHRVLKKDLIEHIWLQFGHEDN